MSRCVVANQWTVALQLLCFSADMNTKGVIKLTTKGHLCLHSYKKHSCKFSFAITGINYSLKYIKIEKQLFKIWHFNITVRLYWICLNKQTNSFGLGMTTLLWALSVCVCVCWPVTQHSYSQHFLCKLSSPMTNLRKTYAYVCYYVISCWLTEI